MNDTRLVNSHRRRALQRGYSLIEVSVAMAVALFLLGGMFTVLQSTRQNSGNQNVLAQLQDQQRIAMTIMTDVIQQAGYFPNAQTDKAVDKLPASATFATAGQSVFGGTDAYGDFVTIRYIGDSTGDVLDCRGSPIVNGTVTAMMFHVQPLNASPNAPLTLWCSMNGNDAPLVPNVRSLAISYGADVSNSGSVNAYLPANQMAPYWTSVESVKLTVSFTNPLFGQPGQTTNPTISFNRVVGIMANSGVNALTYN
jgi:type IV pilus assembly protein PilW